MSRNDDNLTQFRICIKSIRNEENNIKYEIEPGSKLPF